MTNTDTTNRDGYLDAVAAAHSVGDTGAIASLAETSIGVDWTSGAYSRYFLGDLANVGVWNVVLDASERAALDQGVSPHLIRPDALVFFRSLINPLNHPFLGSTLTNNNTATVSAHPRLIMRIGGFSGTTVSVLTIAVTDSVTVGETVDAGVTNFQVVVADAVTVGEDVLVSVGSGNGMATLLLSGTQADINATLATVLYTSNSGYTGPDTLTITSTNLLDDHQHQPDEQCRYRYGGDHGGRGAGGLHLRRGNPGGRPAAPAAFLPHQ
jgi:hypothetical protein